MIAGPLTIGWYREALAPGTHASLSTYGRNPGELTTRIDDKWKGWTVVACLKTMKAGRRFYIIEPRFKDKDKP